MVIAGAISNANAAVAVKTTTNHSLLLKKAGIILKAKRSINVQYYTYVSNGFLYLLRIYDNGENENTLIGPIWPVI
jgi:hypothetical protein